MISRPIAVEPREGYRIWLRYEDGVEGEVDLSDIPHTGFFECWKDKAFFETVHISEFGSIAWDEYAEFCPDALYIEVTGKSPEELMPALRELSTLDLKRGASIERHARLGIGIRR